MALPMLLQAQYVDTYATRLMHELNMLELRGGPEHARAICFTLIAPFIMHL